MSTARGGSDAKCSASFKPSADGSLPGQKQPQYSAPERNLTTPLFAVIHWLSLQSVAMTTSPLGQPEIALVFRDVDLGCIEQNTGNAFLIHSGIFYPINPSGYIWLPLRNHMDSE